MQGNPMCFTEPFVLPAAMANPENAFLCIKKKKKKI